VITYPGASWLKPWYWWSWPVLPLGISWHRQRLDTIGYYINIHFFLQINFHYFGFYISLDPSLYIYHRRYDEEVPVVVIEAVIYLMIVVIAKFRGFFLNSKGYFYRGPDREHCRHPVIVRSLGISCLLGGYLIPCFLIPKTIHPVWGWGLYLLGSLSLIYSTIKAYPVPVLAAFTPWMGIFGVLLVMAYPEYPDGVVRAISVFVYTVVATPLAWSAIIKVARSLDCSIDKESQSPLSDQIIKAC